MLGLYHLIYTLSPQAFAAGRGGNELFLCLTRPTCLPRFAVRYMGRFCVNSRALGSAAVAQKRLFLLILGLALPADRVVLGASRRGSGTFPCGGVGCWL